MWTCESMQQKSAPEVQSWHSVITLTGSAMCAEPKDILRILDSTVLHNVLQPYG